MLTKVVIDFNILNFYSIFAPVALIVFALIMICVSVFNKSLSKNFYGALGLFAILIDFGVVIMQKPMAEGFFDAVYVDGLSILANMVILVGGFLYLMQSFSKKIFHEFNYPELYALTLFSLAGLELMASSNNLLLILIGLEIASLSLYTMIALHNRNASIEAALKYFTMGAFSTGFFAFGIAMFYLQFSTIELSSISRILQTNETKNSFILCLALVFMLVSIGLKLSLMPFHTWLVDVYEGASELTASFIAIVPKIAALVVAIRIFSILVEAHMIEARILLYVIAVVTMTLANIMALVQKDVKRMLAYSSVAHAGFVLCAIVINSVQSYESLFLYWITFMFANIGAFSILWLTRSKAKIWDSRFDHPFEKFSGMSKIAPLAAIAMAIFMFSMAGIPPFSVFWGKFYLIAAAVNKNYIWLAVIMAINSAIALYYYLKIVIYMFLKEPTTEDKSLYLVNNCTSVKLVLSTCAILCLFSIVFIKFLMPLINYYTTLS